MISKVFNVLFLCTGNSARSILAEAIMSRHGKGRFNAYSAGSQPKGKPHPHALKLLASLKYDTTQFSSKSWDEFAKPDAPALDFVFTVCDNAANEICPVWPGQPISAHWSIPDPASVSGSDSEIAAAFADTYKQMNNRISAFMNLPVQDLDRLNLSERLNEIGKS